MCSKSHASQSYDGYLNLTLQKSRIYEEIGFYKLLPIGLKALRYVGL